MLSGVQLERVKDVLKALVNDLSGHDDVEPAPRDTGDEPIAPPETDRPVVRAAGGGARHLFRRIAR